ncbi:MAG: Smr/MutS family protein, partial [Pseudomonadota bacterium]
MSKKTPPENENKGGNNEFRQSVKGVKRIYTDRVDLQQQRKTNNPVRFKINKDIADPFVQEDFLSDQWETAPIDFEESLSFCQNGIDFKTSQALKKGKIVPEDHLDLHGFTMVQAREELTEFIHFAILHDIRCIRIIHGKGYKAQQDYPLLKNKVNSWLRQHPQVLAFHS